jgi:hypothetical protein
MSKTQITAEPGIRRPAQILQAAFAEGRLDDASTNCSPSCWPADLTTDLNEHA